MMTDGRSELTGWGGLCLASHWVQPFTHIGEVVQEAEERNVKIRLLLKTWILGFVLSGISCYMLLEKLKNIVIDSKLFDFCKVE